MGGQGSRLLVVSGLGLGLSEFDYGAGGGHHGQTHLVISHRVRYLALDQSDSSLGVC